MLNKFFPENTEHPEIAEVRKEKEQRTNIGGGWHADHSYDDYAPAYRVGYEGAGRYAGRRFDEVETDLRRDYDSVRGSSKLSWEKAKSAARAAWDRIERAMPGDADGDGR